MERQDAERRCKLNTHQSKEPDAKLLSDYTAPNFSIETVTLQFLLEKAKTTITSHINFRRSKSSEKGLLLDGGEGLTLCSVDINGKRLAECDYTRSGETLTIHKVPDDFELSIVTEIIPEENTRLEGLYKSSGNYCTQCEAEGFRHITFYLDRPDVMATFDVTIIADKNENPVLLSNGNLEEEGDMGEGMHFARWVDPWPKPAYLFALVAGQLSILTDGFQTKSGKHVCLNIYAIKKDIPKCGFAMQSLIKSMEWDEQVFGLEYDLDVYNIVAVGDFNMGAMENKGLNVFNTKYVLADSQTATDTDYDHIQGVIGHEYFHNWTGNRVTCRDWFQLSLKEGLTVFRDQEFSSDMGSRAVKRLDDVRVLRSFQFPEDSGPLAHPIRPEKYIEINNFYTATVYNKGAEVIRMMYNIVGADNFHKGMKIYFERHDGQAVTCEDFISAMEAASGLDLAQFRLWYSQAGTPHVFVDGFYIADKNIYKLTLRQSCAPTPDQTDKQPLHMPIVIGLLGRDGRDMNVTLGGGSQNTSAGIMLDFHQKEQIFTFENVREQPVLSLLRGFSAPIILENSFSIQDQSFLLAHDRDPFARWEAGQYLAKHAILEGVEAKVKNILYTISEDLIDSFGIVCEDLKTDPALLAEILTLPSESYIGQFMDVVDVDNIHTARQALKREIASKYYFSLVAVYQRCNEQGVFDFMNAQGSAARRLKNVALSYMVASGEQEALKLLETQYKTASTMTDRLAALSELCHTNLIFREEALSDFYNRWKEDDLVLDKWFSVQACSMRQHALPEIVTLSNHPDFKLKNPNRVRALVSAFAMNNQVRFHDRSGEGYRFLTSIIQKIDTFNPQVAARMVAPLGQWRKFDSLRQKLMKIELEKLATTTNSSPDVYELAHRSLIG